MSGIIEIIIDLAGDFIELLLSSKKPLKPKETPPKEYSAYITDCKEENEPPK